MSMKSIIYIWLIKIIARLPLGFLHKTALVSASILNKLEIRENKITKRNLKIVFADKDEEFKKNIFQQSTTETLKTLLETPKIWNGDTNKFTQLIYNIKNQELTEQAFNQGGGLILAVPHIGSWEVAGLWLSLNYPTTGLFKRSGFARIDKLTEKSRSKFGARLVPDTTKGIIALIRALKRGEATCILPDQTPGDGSGYVYADFFGINSKTSTLIPKLLQKTDARLVMAYALRLSNGKFELVFKQPNDKVYSSDLNTATGVLNQELETIILQHPQQYTWSYNRFKKSKIN